MSQDCNSAGPKRHRKFSYTPGNNHRRGLFRCSSVPHLSFPPIQTQHRRTTSVGVDVPPHGWMDEQPGQKDQSRSPFNGGLRGRESYPPSQNLRRDRVSREVEIPDAWAHTEAWKTSFP